MYINFWYPIATSDEVNNKKPFRAQVLGAYFVAFRDDAGGAHVLSDVCIHRGGALGKGWVRDNTVVCPYHGWRFGGDGQCTHIPSLVDEQDKPPARAKVDSYPVQEKYGIVFAFLGDLPESERPPLLEVEEYEQDGWRANNLTVFEVNAFYERSMENGLDPSHNEFVHPAQGGPVVPDLRKHPPVVEDNPWGSRFLVTFANPLENKPELMTAKHLVSDVTAGSGHVGPNGMITWIKLSADSMFSQYFFEAPVNESLTRIFFVSMRTFMLEPEMDDRLTKLNLLIAQEDIDILEELDPVRTPDSNNEEVLVPSDGGVIHYRKYLAGWRARGWRIDLKTLRAERGDRAYAIPSPARRTSRNWVLKSVPLLSS
jgi:phenylpropionate dioxygenase-like ring-hydroxylating dioxygenase large terminal subunit